MLGAATMTGPSRHRRLAGPPNYGEVLRQTANSVQVSFEPGDARESLGSNTDLVAEAFGEVTTAPADRGSKRFDARTAVTGRYTIPGKADLARCRAGCDPALQHGIEHGEAVFPGKGFMQSLMQFEIDPRADHVGERKNSVR